jgi:dihydrofolate reductase
MQRKIIVSTDENGLIGNNGKLPWHIPEELKLFKQVTMGNPIIMGRKTWESLPKKPLPGRFNIVLSKSMPFGYQDSQTYVANEWMAALGAAEIHSQLDSNAILIIGGAQIYKEALENNYVDSIILSEVKGKYDGDTYFPKIDEAKWRKKLISSHDQFIVYEYELIEKVCEESR